MKKQILLAAMIATGLAAGLALAPAAFAEDAMKPATTKSMNKDKMDKTKSGPMMDKKDGMKKSDGMTKSDGMKKDGMSK